MLLDGSSTLRLDESIGNSRKAALEHSLGFK